MPDISVSIGGSNAQFQALVADTLKRLEGMKPSIAAVTAKIAAIAAPIAGAVGLGAGFVGIAEAIKGVMEKGRDLQQVMAETGNHGTAILQVQRAFKSAGLEAEGVGPAIGHLNKELSGMNKSSGEAKKLLSDLGINMDVLKDMDVAYQFQTIGKAISQVQDPAKRTGIAMKLFGEAGEGMLRIFANPSAVQNLTAPLSLSQRLLAANAGLYARITKAVAAFQGQLKSGFGLFAGLAAGVAPGLQVLLEKLPKIDLTRLGAQVGNVVSLLVQAFQDNRLGELISLGLQVGMGKAINYLAGILAPIGRAMSELIRTDLEGMIGALGTSFDGIFDLVEGGLLKAFEGPVRYLQAAFESALQTMQYLADKMSGKQEDTSGLGDMSDAQRQEYAGKQQQVMHNRFRQLAHDQLIDPDNMSDREAAQVAGAAVNDPTYKNAQQEYERARHYDPSRYARRAHSTEEIMASNANEPVRIGLNGGRTAEEMMSDGTTKMKAGFEQLPANAEKFGGIVKQAFKDIKPVDAVDVSAPQGKLTNLVGELNNKLDAARTRLNANQTANSDQPEANKTAPEIQSSEKGANGPEGKLAGAINDKSKAEGAMSRVQPPSSSLARIGGGGYSSAGIAGIMTQQTALLQTIAKTNSEIAQKTGKEQNVPLLGHIVAGGARVGSAFV